MNFVSVSLRENLFWLQIMQEHALFIRLGLPCDEVALIREAQRLENLFKSLLARARKTPRTPDAVRKLNEDVIKALNKIIDFKSRLLKLIITCRIGGSNLPLLIDHVRREAIRFRMILIRLQNNIKVPIAEEALQEEIFWLRIMGDHARFIAHLLDPSERMLVNVSRKFADRFETLRLQSCDLNSMEVPRSFENFLLPADKIGKPVPLDVGRGLPSAFVIPRLQRFNTEVIDATKDIREFKQKALQLVKTCTILSIIPPLLADHVLREAEKALEDLKEMQNLLTPRPKKHRKGFFFNFAGPRGASIMNKEKNPKSIIM